MKKPDELPPVPPAPPELSERSRELWTATLRSRSVSPVASWRELLRVALLALDRADAARVRIDADGLMVAGEKMAHCHPLLPVEKDSRAAFMKAWLELQRWR